MSTIDRTLLPIEEELFSSEVAYVGAFRCPPHDPLFHNTGPTRNHLFAFPRTTVTIEHEHQRPFVSTPHNVNFYNRGQHYVRYAVDRNMGDICEFFVVAPSLLLDVLREHDRFVEERPDQPFTRPYLEVHEEIFARERTLIEWIRAADRDALEIEEGITWLVDSLAGDLSHQADPLPAAAVERVEEAKAMLARHVAEPLSIADVALATGSSVYYLCRIFRRHTGMTMTAYRLKLRLRLAFDEVTTSTDLLTTALNLGFSSHSY